MTNKEFRFENLSFGDVIIAKRGVNTDNIKEGHKNGPFIVLENNGKYLTCLYCTSQINRKKLKAIGLKDSEIKQVIIKLQLLGLDLNKRMYS